MRCLALALIAAAICALVFAAGWYTASLLSPTSTSSVAPAPGGGLAHPPPGQRA